MNVEELEKETLKYPSTCKQLQDVTFRIPRSTCPEVPFGISKIF